MQRFKSKSRMKLALSRAMRHLKQMSDDPTLEQRVDHIEMFLNHQVCMAMTDDARREARYETLH